MSGRNPCPQLVRRIALAGLAVLVLSGCPRKGVREAPTVSVFVSGDISLEFLSRAARAVNARREIGPCIWVCAGNALADRAATAFRDGEFQVRALDAAGVDAVVLGQEWFELGTDRCYELIAGAGFLFLGANLVDSLAEPFGHPLLVRRSGMDELGLTAGWLDSTSAFLYQPGIGYTDADLSLRKTVLQLRRNAGVVGVVNRPGPGEAAAADFVIGRTGDDVLAVLPPGAADRLVRFDLLLGGNRILDYALVEEDLTRFEPDSAVEAVVRPLVAEVDSLGGLPVVESNVVIGPDVLTRALADGFVRGDIDAFVYDEPIASRALEPGTVTRADLVRLLKNPGRLAILELTGRDMKELFDRRTVTVEWRGALRMQRTMMNRTYRIAVTLDFLDRHPDVAAKGFRFSQEQSWPRAAELLAKLGEK